MTASMRAVVRTGSGARLHEVPVPVPGPGEARLRVELAGICRTDLYAAEGRLAVPTGRVLGHEMVGVVEAVGPDRAIALGTRVTVAPRLPDADGGSRMLGLEVDGAFAEQVVVPVVALHEVPATLPARLAAYTEPLAAALAIFEAPLGRHDAGVVLGSGRIAELTLRLLRLRGHERVEHHHSAASLPRSRYRFAIETAATSEAIDGLVQALEPGGCLVLKSRPPAPVAIDVARAVARRVRMHAVDYGSFTEAIALLPRLDVEALLGDTTPLAGFASAFARAQSSESKKLFLQP